MIIASRLMNGRVRLAMAAVPAMLLLTFSASVAHAQPAKTAWSIAAIHGPTNFAPGGAGKYLIVPSDAGALPSKGTVTVTATIPASVTAKTMHGVGWSCTLASLTCTSASVVAAGAEANAIELEVEVSKAAGEGEALSGHFEVSGGGAAAAATTSDVATVSTAPASFGLQSFSASLLDAAGQPEAQAGAHPYEMTTSLFFNTNLSKAGIVPAGNIKDVNVTLPAGLLGNPQAAPKCPQYDMVVQAKSACPPASQVGTLTLYIGGFGAPSRFLEVVGVYNLVPTPGVPAEFGFTFLGVPFKIAAHVIGGGGQYVISTTTANISEAYKLYGVSLTLWGVPAESSHTAERRLGFATGQPAGVAEAPFLSDPLDCAAGSLQPPAISISVDSWQQPSVARTAPPAQLAAPTGCEALRFSPGIAFAPEQAQAGAPSGYSFELKVPQSEAPESVATPELKDATVSLPAGVAISPSSAGGLQACSAAQIDLESSEPASCPPASKIGEVQIETPLLEKPLSGQVFLAEPGCGGICSEADAEEGRMVGLYLQVQGSGVRIKLPGSVEIGGAASHSTSSGLQPGQLRAKFLEDPQLPFSKLTLNLKGGARAPLVNPSTCGIFTTTSQLTPWSAPFTSTATPSAQLTISGCATPGFSPSFTAGAVNNQAAGYSPFTLTLTRQDGEQALNTIATTLPPGLAGMIAKVNQCGEAQANAGTCPAASLIGTTTVTAGPGPDAYQLAGSVYLTGPYRGAPFGLAIVVPAVAGPFHLAGTNGAGDVVVRARIEVNPRTAQVSVASEPLPQMLDGIPISLKVVNVTIDREGFMFNPTSCAPMSVNGTIGSAEGASEAVASRFEAANCASLPFKPKFSALIHAGHTRKNGEYLHVVIGSVFGQANLRKVHVTLPVALPSRDSTLKLACTEAQFAKNPSGCPAGSVVGHAVVHTPVLAKPLEGPAIFVSHGGLAFPDLDLVLQGEGVTIVNVGNTNIHKGITSTTFGAIPDVPVSRIDLVLPAGPHSALAGEGNLCRKHLRMPTEIEGQNGAVIRQKTKIAVEGCGPQFFVRKKHVRGSKATIVLHVPYAGKLVANGKGISKVSKRIAKHGGRMAVTVKLKAHFRRMLALSHRHHITVKVHLSFHSKHHKTLHAAVRVRLR